MRVGYIGLGLMGKAIAGNILKGGFPLTVHNRSKGAVEELVSRGARRADSPARVAAESDVVFTNLPDTPDVEQVVLGQAGIIEGGRPGLIVVDNSTIRPEAARAIAARLAEKEMAFLDAPVSGGDVGARGGTGGGRRPGLKEKKKEKGWGGRAGGAAALRRPAPCGGDSCAALRRH